LIGYLDSSALTKRYVVEPGSELRGYDAVQLAAASLWQKSLEIPVTLISFDRQLWTAARHEGMIVRPEAL
jgi:predicted nucleic acid-binding protein